MIYIHPTTKRRLDILSSELPQSLLLRGEPGVGLLTIAKQLAGDDLALILRPENAKGVFDQQGTIAVEKIRDLYDQTRSKHTKPYIVIIDDANKMSAGAQAAFLKLLEEPATNIHFLLLSHTPERLLPTIRSRVQHLVILPISQAQTDSLLADLSITDKTKRTQLLFIASGLPAEIIRLTRDEDYFSTRAVLMGDGRQLLQANAYEKLLVVNKYQSDRTTAIELIDSMLLIARRSMSTKPSTTIIKQLDLLLDIQANIAAGYNVRLQLARCAL